MLLNITDILSWAYEYLIRKFAEGQGQREAVVLLHYFC